MRVSGAAAPPLMCSSAVSLVLPCSCGLPPATIYPSKGPPSHPSSSPRRSPLPQPLQHPLHALLPPHQPPSPVAHDPPSAPTHFRRTAHAVSAPPPPRPGPPLPRPRFKIKGPPALAPPPSASTCPHFSTPTSVASEALSFRLAPMPASTRSCRCSVRFLTAIQALFFVTATALTSSPRFLHCPGTALLLRVLPRCQAPRPPRPPCPRLAL